MNKLLFVSLLLFFTACETKEITEEKTTDEKLESENKSGDFTFRVVADKSKYLTTDTVNIRAYLKYTGPLDSVVIAHSASPFWFHLKEKQRNIELPYAQNMPLIHTTLIKVKWLEEQYQKGGGYSEIDPNGAFMKDFFTTKTFPKGSYEMKASAQFHIGEDAARKEFVIPVVINFEVTEPD